MRLLWQQCFIKTVSTGAAEAMWIENRIYAYDAQNFSLYRLIIRRLIVFT